MNSNEIARFIGRKTSLRDLAYLMFRATTLREWYIRSELKKIFSTNSDDFKFLEIGSGMGQYAISVGQSYLNAKVAAYDIDDVQVKDCNYYVTKKKLLNTRFYQGDLQNVRLDGKYDVILCASLLEHIEEDSKVLKKLYEAMNDDGYLLVYVPSDERRILASLERKQQKMIKESGKKYLHEHVRYYPPQELAKKLQNIGFEIEKVTITYGNFGALAYDIVTLVQYSALFKYIFPFYLLFIHPFVLPLMLADFIKKNKSGNGLMIVAQKK